MQVTVAIPAEQYQEIVLRQFGHIYTTDEVHPTSVELNTLRMEVLTQLLAGQLVPVVARETRQRLLQDARAHVLQTISDELWKHAKMPPLRLKCTMDEVRRAAMCTRSYLNTTCSMTPRTFGHSCRFAR